MPIKTPTGAVTGEDFTAALESLRVSVAEVAKASGIPRTYLSDLRNHGTPLRREYTAKLRAWLIEQGIEFDDASAGDAPASPAHVASAPHPRLAVETVTRCYFPIAEDLPAATVAAAIDRMDANDARLLGMFKKPAEKESTLFGQGDFSDEAKALLQEAFASMAENYIIFRMLRGWPAFDKQPEKQDVESVRDVMFGTFKAVLIDTGIIQPVAEIEPDEVEA